MQGGGGGGGVVILSVASCFSFESPSTTLPSVAMDNSVTLLTN